MPISGFIQAARANAALSILALVAIEELCQHRDHCCFRGIGVLIDDASNADAVVKIDDVLRSNSVGFSSVGANCE